MRILIFTSGKTGSSALAGAIQKKLLDHELIFEPPRLENIDDNKGNLIVKSLALCHWGTEVHKFSTYDKRIFLVRHPFDRLVSALLYAPFNGQGFESDVNARRYVDMIREKSESPDSVSILQICELFKEVSGFDLLKFIGDEVRCHREFYSVYKDEFVTIRYEDIISGSRDDLEGCLGFELEESLSVPSGFERVSRNRKSGDWLHWFCESDQKVLALTWKDYFNDFSFYSSGTPLNVSSPISAESSWSYVLKMINAFRLESGKALFAY